MEISKILEDGKITLKVSGRLNTVTASELENEVSAIGDDINEVVFDFENLEYLSSAGLRILIKTQQRKKSVKLINVSTEVYEVFSITGFTKLFDIEKK